MSSSKTDVDVVIPVVREFATIQKRLIDRHRVLVHKTVEEVDQTVEALLRLEDVTVEHVPIGQVVEAAPPVREVDGVTIIPVVEERLVVRTELVLREELHIRRTARQQPTTQIVRLRREVVAVERQDLTPNNPKERKTMSMDTTPYDADLATASGETYDPARHESQIVAMYDTRAEAQAALDKLNAEGLGHGAHVSDDQPSATGGAVEDEGIWASIKRLFAPEDEVHGYREGLRRGHGLLVVHPAGEIRSRVIDVLETTNPIDLDTKVEEWRQEGWSETPVVTGNSHGYDANAAAAPAMSTSAGMAPVEGPLPVNAVPAATPLTAGAGMAASGAAATDSIELMEERLRVGKREVARGGVRVRSYVVERPVEETVTLHEETVHLDRRPVDRAAAPGEATFQDRTVEMTARAEEAVVEKQARVVEEISLHKDATDRTETIHDKVRHTEVEVEDDRAGVAPVGTVKTTPL